MQSGGYGPMQDKTTDTGASPSAERRAWEAPRLTAVTPVDRTKGGAKIDFFNENALYRIS